MKVPTDFNQVDFNSFAEAQPAFHVVFWHVSKRNILRVYASKSPSPNQVNQFLIWFNQ